MIVYAETSAVIPLIKKEPTSESLRSYFGDLINDGHLLLTARLTETELRRTAHRYGVPQTFATAALEALAVEEMTPAHFKLAGTIGDTSLRSLDALHVAVAASTGCSAVITLDKRVEEAADSVGIPALDPTRPAKRGHSPLI
ncbi:MAG TPA: type II toxin-antitoxin system VapC family toxin [Candidatus Nanopelagicales bacterium]|nr:type II toxin-antitoxin system VapC family toxin [Candidatus Nanopelagicales bacterium]